MENLLISPQDQFESNIDRPLFGCLSLSAKITPKLNTIKLSFSPSYRYKSVDIDSDISYHGVQEIDQYAKDWIDIVLNQIMRKLSYEV
ncbi:MAG: hypothetical protein UZ20_WS6002000015 [candidate division WS6 bacterium OLB21]|uniref:Uncharacterized protein n=1 Tax=candidate division WS6 bacterium OLB21 TaxID=1617427 RepID=A0A136KLL7_9BACT|nr:MAG: hypothetical protein UZ20_WS6002000015 [candidate division WS6 bacterium OLB21]